MPDETKAVQPAPQPDVGTIPVPESVATGRDSPPTAREPAAGNREEDRPTAEPEDARQERADGGREDDSARQADRRDPAVNPMLAGQGAPRATAYDPATTGPGRMHGRTHRLRQDEGLGPGDMVEMTVRPGMPEGWDDFVAAAGGLDALRKAVSAAGEGRRGINLVAAHGEHVDRNLVRELRAASVPSRLIRRAKA